jgi:hypothetical protein
VITDARMAKATAVRSTPLDEYTEPLRRRRLVEAALNRPNLIMAKI